MATPTERYSPVGIKLVERINDMSVALRGLAANIGQGNVEEARLFSSILAKRDKLTLEEIRPVVCKALIAYSDRTGGSEENLIANLERLLRIWR